jgi:hypothetical protein
MARSSFGVLPNRGNQITLTASRQSSMHICCSLQSKRATSFSFENQLFFSAPPLQAVSAQQHGLLKTFPSLSPGAAPPDSSARSNVSLEKITDNPSFQNSLQMDLFCIT